MDAAIYYTDIRPLAPIADRLAKKLPPLRRARMAAYRRREDQLRCLAAWLLLERCLGPRLDESKLRKGEHGKPYLPGGPHFNLSHSGDFAIAAIDSLPVGADVERHRDEDFRALAGKAFHPHEREFLAGENAERRFFDIWTLKESYLKMRGSGLSLNPTSFCLHLQGREARLHTEPELRLRLYDTLPGYSVALCSPHDGWPGTLRGITFTV